MSNNKQSSVDVILNLLVEKGYAGLLDEDEIEQAKEIHRVEIIESYASGSNDRLRNTINTNYYNETFENTK